ncbi:threonine/serine exporter family protein (plasmid) [Nicoliella spurrieriana]|uniref:Threonine/serine exporter family protein n=1 Tax=Nicoliella spurrieriana TaxID=2925830 RepID=A0A976RQV4_9LACO|nr:threonine/serine exporter family protein [Nicoliella spurrieriana]UQS86137.1 threonine/serine exporter family protein [Nicoliella spurrieriana]
MVIGVEFLFGFLSTWGFGVITNVPRRTLIASGIVGALAWLVYIFADGWGANVIVANLLPGITVGLFANVESMLIKTPVNLIFVPAVISLVPGALFYKSMEQLTLGLNMLAMHGLLKTLLIAFSLGIGFIIGEVCFRILKPLIRRLIHFRFNYKK